jgi:hypothetical protein
MNVQDSSVTPTEEKVEDEKISSQAQFWRQLPDEHFDLLRLTAQPTDRDTGARPLRFVQFARLERHSQEQSLLRLSIQVPEQSLRKEQNHLELWLDHSRQAAQFRPANGLSVEPQNRGLGRFLLAQAALWGRQHGALYELIPAEPFQQPLSVRARLFLRQILHAPQDAHQMASTLPDEEGASAPLGDLNTEWNREKVQIVGRLESALLLQQLYDRHNQQDALLRKQSEQLTQFRHEKSTLHFTITCLWIFNICMAGLLIWIAVH